MGINCLVADPQRFSRACIGVAARDGLQDCEFAIRDRNCFDMCLQQSGCAGTERCIADANLADNLNDFAF